MVQTLTLGGEEYAVIPRSEYDALRRAVDEDALDAVLLQQALDAPDQELVPIDVVKRVADGEHPVRVWRRHRGLTSSALAARAGIAASYVSDIENGKKPGSISSMKRLAAALGVGVEDLI